MRSPSLTLFEHVVDRTDDEIELDVAALLLGEWDYDHLDIERYRRRLDYFAEVVQHSQRSHESFSDIRALNRGLFRDLGFRGNESSYYDPRNSFLHEVIDRRTGIPISLSVLYMEVARRIDVHLQGISFPGHFLVRYDHNEASLIIDPFSQGVTLDRSDLQTRLERVPGNRQTSLTADMLQGVDKHHILLRMLNNLLGIYRSRGDKRRAREVLERMSIVAPDNARINDELAKLGKGRADIN